MKNVLPLHTLSDSVTFMYVCMYVCTITVLLMYYHGILTTLLVCVTMWSELIGRIPIQSCCPQIG